MYDAATRFTKGMYPGQGSFYCVSFQIKKRLPIGRGGMIFTDNKGAYDWFRQARHQGRHMDVPQWEDEPEMLGWTMYMTPEDAARGVLLFDQLPEVNEDSGCQNNYPDISGLGVFK